MSIVLPEAVIRDRIIVFKVDELCYDCWEVMLCAVPSVTDCMAVFQGRHQKQGLAAIRSAGGGGVHEGRHLWHGAAR